MKPQSFDRDLKEIEPKTLSVAPLRDWVAALFSEKLHVEVSSVETDLIETGALDSLTFIELLLHLEQKLGFKISLEDLELENFRSITGIAKFIASSNGNQRNGFNHPPSSSNGNG